MHRWVGLMAGVLVCAGAPVWGYAVGPALSLADLTAQADVIVKVQAVASAPVADPWFEAMPGYVTTATTMRRIATFKGEAAGEQLSFHHYAPDERGGGMPYMPQWYRFQLGRCYLLFAAKTAQPGVLGQMTKSHRSQEDQGSVLAANDDPRTGLTVDRVVWAELIDLLHSRDSDAVPYGLSHLDRMSGGAYERLQDFDRKDVLAAVLPLIQDPRTDLARAAITVMGSRNPYLLDEYAPFWLATVGHGNIDGMGAWDPKRENLGGKLYWRQLAVVADSTQPAETRALAIRALGRAGVPELLPMVQRWAKATDPLVRQAAAVLLADFPTEVELLRALSADHDAPPRAGAAWAIGFAQLEGLVPDLSRLVQDHDAKVAQAAAMSLLSFPTATARPVLEAHVNDPQWGCLFVNALAKTDPAPYLTQLEHVIRTAASPENWWGGAMPWGVSWNLLFRYAQQQSTEALASAALQPALDALEAPAAEAGKQPSYYSSSEPRDLYALYLQHGLTERAKAFRERCRKALSYDIESYFKMVDANPGAYSRQ